MEQFNFVSHFQGKYFNFLGYFFSLYCIWKIFISTVNIIFDRVGKMDPISKVLALTYLPPLCLSTDCFFMR